MMAAVTLTAFVGGWVHGRMAAPAAQVEASVAAVEGPADAGEAADLKLAAADAAMVAAIAAADPPYLVRLHLAEGAAPRDVARLVTAVTAWGFPAPERLAAAEPVAMPEVRFHDDADREAARVLGAVAGRLLGEAVLTPPAPQSGAGLNAALASLGAPAADVANAATGGVAGVEMAPRVLDVFIPAQ